MVVTTCFGMPTNERKHTIHYSGLKGTLVRIQHVEEIFLALYIKKFLYICRRDKYNDVNKHHFVILKKMY